MTDLELRASTTLIFHHYGIPRPQGSMKVLTKPSSGKAILIPSGGSQFAEWRNGLVQTALNAMEEHGNWPAQCLGPMELLCNFAFPRPKSHSKRRVLAETGFMDTGPDADKLLRAVSDALEIAGVVDNDRQFAVVCARKAYLGSSAQALEHVGVEVMVRRLDLDPNQENS